MRPDREGLQIAQVSVEPGDTVVTGQVLARLVPPDGQPGAGVPVRAPAGGTIVSAAATVGTTASGRAPPLFRIAARGEMELLAEAPVNDLATLAPDQEAKVEIVGVGELPGKVRLISTAINPMTQLGQVRVFIGNDPKLARWRIRPRQDRNRGKVRSGRAALGRSLWAGRRNRADGSRRPRGDPAGDGRAHCRRSGGDSRGIGGRGHDRRAGRGLSAGRGSRSGRCGKRAGRTAMTGRRFGCFDSIKAANGRPPAEAVSLNALDLSVLDVAPVPFHLPAALFPVDLFGAALRVGGRGGGGRSGGGLVVSWRAPRVAGVRR